MTYVDLFGVETEPPGRRRRARKHTPGEQTTFPVASETDPNSLEAAWFVARPRGSHSAVLTWYEYVNGELKLQRTEVSAAEVLALLSRGPATITGPAPYVKGSATSEAAAKRLSSSGKLAGKRERVLREILTHWSTGVTDNEATAYMVETYRWSPNTARPRRIELTRAGWLEDSGERRNGGIVWVPSPKAWAWWRQSTNE